MLANNAEIDCKNHRVSEENLFKLFFLARTSKRKALMTSIEESHTEFYSTARDVCEVKIRARHQVFETMMTRVKLASLSAVNYYAYRETQPCVSGALFINRSTYK